jgi:hypothetical protein
VTSLSYIYPSLLPWRQLQSVFVASRSGVPSPLRPCIFPCSSQTYDSIRMTNTNVQKKSGAL